MKKTYKKLNKRNLFLLIILVLCLLLIVSDFIYLFLHLADSAGLTAFGLLTFISAAVVAGLIFDYLESK